MFCELKVRHMHEQIFDTAHGHADTLHDTVMTTWRHSRLAFVRLNVQQGITLLS